MMFPAYDRYCRESRLAPLPVIAEEQGSDYESGLVRSGAGLWRIRTARITPGKPGAFVAVWRRGPDGVTKPFGEADTCDILMVFVQEDSRFGVFTFTRDQLVSLGVLQSARTPGKRGFRVYPSWCTDLNERAARTQRAQAPAFTALSG